MRRACTFALLIAVVLTLSPLLALAQPTSYSRQWWSSPDYSIFRPGSTAPGVLATADATGKFYNGGVSRARGYLYAGVAAAARVDMNGVGGTAVGGYFMAEGLGIPGGLQDEVVGVYARVDKNGPYWSTALHGECIINSPDPGGFCAGANIELYGANPETMLVGINVQPKPETSGVIGLQFQNPATYKWTVDTANAPIRLGQANDRSLCLKFEPRTQRLEFWNGCGDDLNPRRVGYIDMSSGGRDVRMNR